MFEILPETKLHKDGVDALLDKAFGPGRFAKTAYRLREGVACLPELSYVAMCHPDGSEDSHMVGSLRFWPILIGGQEALMLGPLAMDPDVQGKGGGIALMQQGLKTARELGHRLVILVGDLPYYARVGFKQVPLGQMQMPGPVDGHRLLYCDLTEGALEGMAGAIERCYAHNPVPGMPVAETHAD